MKLMLPTINLCDGGHTHVGDPDFTFESLIDSLHDLLCCDRGLSIVKNNGGNDED